MQSLEQEELFHQFLKQQGYIPYLELQEQMHMGTRMYQMSNFNNAHAFINVLLSTYSHLKWECLHRLDTEERLCTQNSCVHSIYSTKRI